MSQNNYTGYRPEVTLVGQDGNAFAIMGAVRLAMRGAWKDGDLDNYKEVFEEYQKEATSGDYDNLLQVTMKYCEVR